MSDGNSYTAKRRAILAGGFLLILLGSLSVHVVMLQVLNVPYPANLPANGWARLPDRLLSVLGAVTLFVMLPVRTKARPLRQRAALLFVLIGTIHETLFRLPVMNIVTASRWTGWPFLDALPSYLIIAAVAVAIVAVRRMLVSPVRCVIATLVIGIPIHMLLSPALKTAFAGMARWTSSREGYTVYNPPYDWHVEVPAYITFAEPVLAAFAVAALVSGRLPRNRLRAIAVLAALLFALRGQFFSTFINIRYAGTDAATAMLSFGQFTLESLVLAVLAAGTWVIAMPATVRQDISVHRRRG